MKRRAMSKRSSQKNFRRNAGAKKINYRPTASRGGFRL